VAHFWLSLAWRSLSSPAGAMLTDGDPEMSHAIKFVSVRGIAKRGGGILGAIAVVSLMPACSKEG
jgi:hypothetical protein